YEYLAARLEQSTQERIKSSLANLQHRLEALLRSGHEGLVAEEIADFGSNIDVNSLVMLDDHQQVRHATQRIWLGKPASTVIPGFDSDHFARAQQDHVLALHSDPLHYRILAYQPISLTARPGEIRATQTGVLLVDYSLALGKAQIWRDLWNDALTNLLISGITMLILIVALRHWLSHPLNYLRDVVIRISRGDFKSAVEINGSGELVELGAAVNKMQGDLSSARTQSQSAIRLLRNREQELKKITDTLPGPISRFDENGRYLFASAAYLDWFGILPESVLAKKHRDVLGDALYVAYAPHIEQALAGNAGNFEARIPNPSGGMRDAMITVLPDTDTDGTVCGYYTICVDITERKRGEERFRAAVEAAPNAMLMVDEQGIITMVNTRTLAMFGYNQEELLGQTINVLVPEHYRSTHRHDMQQFMAHPAGRNMGMGRDLYARHRDGHEIPVEIGLNPLATNEGRFVIASVLDISERKLALEKLQQKNSELERYTHMVSHDLKSPLVTIKTFLGYLKEDLEKNDPARIEKDMAFMSQAADKMSQLLDELLEMSRIGRVVALPEHISWRDAVQEALNINAGAIAQRGVQVTIEDADIMLSILLVEDDPAHAEIVRRNLENARVANQLHWVADGQEALDFLQHSGKYQNLHDAPVPGLILLDLRLPKVDGIEVLNAVKSDPQLAKIPVVVMTTSAAESDIARAYENRANSYVVKPLDLGKFTALLDVIGYYWLVWNERPL
ncbi:MAG: PAS domain S-box protein, partial [Nitrosomonadales bacterium]|nr:PAS domain S-box protein [Nitrosomonadales bacterium]